MTCDCDCGGEHKNKFKCRYISKTRAVAVQWKWLLTVGRWCDYSPTEGVQKARYNLLATPKNSKQRSFHDLQGLGAPHT